MNIFRRAIYKFGQRHQMMMAVEEMSELTKEIIKHLRYGKSNIEEEIADVKIIIAQLEEMFDAKLVQEWMNAKLLRLDKLLKEDYKIIRDDGSEC